MSRPRRSPSSSRARRSARPRTTNPHFAHVDSSGLGITIVEIDGERLSVEMIALGDVLEPDPSTRRVERFVVARGSTTIEASTG